jgi:hypothetical protein
MVEYCLSNHIISEEDIKYVIFSSLSIPKKYFDQFIAYLYDNLPEQIAKLAVNGMIGSFKPKDRDVWEHIIPPTTDYNNCFYHFLAADGTNIHARQVGYTLYFQGLRKHKMIKEETEAPIYNMILEQEAIELHKLATPITSNGGTV